MAESTEKEKGLQGKEGEEKEKQLDQDHLTSIFNKERALHIELNCRHFYPLNKNCCY